MQIIFYEYKKAFQSPIFISLLVLFTAYNLFVIHSYSDRKEELKVVNQIVQTYGLEITEQSLQQLQEESAADLIKLNAITQKRMQESFSSIEAFLEKNYGGAENPYTEKEWQFFNESYLKKMYWEQAQVSRQAYEKLDWIKIGESLVADYELNEAAGASIRQEAKKLAVRVDALIENNEHQTWFFAGQVYKMHSLLFRTVFIHLIIEGMLLIVLATIFITNYEYDQRTQLLSYTTWRGRKLMYDKLSASILASLSILLALFLPTLGFYFITFDYHELWMTSVNSLLNWEGQLPYVSWRPLNYASYFVLSLSVVVLCLLLFSLVAYTIVMLVKNSYFAVIMFGLWFITAFLLSGFMPRSRLLLAAHFNLSTLILNPHIFFMGNSRLMMFQYYEGLTLSFWSVLIVSGVIFTYQKFKRQDIH